MGKYIKIAEQERMFLEDISKVGVLNFICMAEGKWDYYQITLTNGKTRWWKSITFDFEEKLKGMIKEQS